MIYKHVVLDLKKRIEKLEKTDIIFTFLDALGDELKNQKKNRETTNDIIFIDYRDQSKYIVNIDLVNKTLKFCYEKFYLKPKLENIVVNIETNNNFFFKKSLLLLLKTIKSYDAKVSNDMFKNLLLEISEDLIFSSENEYKNYFNYIRRYNYDINFLMKIFEPFFFLSTEIFVFSQSFDYALHSARIQLYSDVKTYLIEFYDKGLTNIDYSIDLILQYYILISFINANFYFNYRNYADILYIKHLVPLAEESNLPYFLKKDAYFPTIYQET